MSDSREVVFVSGVRTAIGTFGGSLKDIPPTKLGAAVVREAIRRAGIEAGEVGSIAFGHILNTEPRDMYMARVAGVEGGMSIESSAITVNRLCGSGLQAIVTAAQQIMLSDVDIAIAGGAENMSRAPYALPAERWGQKMGDAKVVDMLVGALSDPFGAGHMGITAENLSVKYQVSRDEQDAFALQSHQRAAKAREAGYFKDQILPFEIESRKGKISFEADEHIRTDVSADNLKSLKPVFKKDGTVTAGNASGINDGAAALVMMDAKTAAKKGLKPMARLVSYGIAGVEPSEMGIGPVPAVQMALKKAGLKVSDMDVVESNEAFAAQAISVAKNLGFDPAKTNPNGGAVALGHPIGASGAVITVKALYELKRINKRYGLITLCIGGGQGIAAVIENLN